MLECADGYVYALDTRCALPRRCCDGNTYVALFHAIRPVSVFVTLPPSPRIRSINAFQSFTSSFFISSSLCWAVTTAALSSPCTFSLVASFALVFSSSSAFVSVHEFTFFFHACATVSGGCASCWCCCTAFAERPPLCITYTTTYTEHAARNTASNDTPAAPTRLARVFCILLNVLLPISNSTTTPKHPSLLSLSLSLSLSSPTRTPPFLSLKIQQQTNDVFKIQQQTNDLFKIQQQK